MAAIREIDTASWLHNKLYSDDMWSGSNISSFLNKEVLRNTQECFHTLDSQIKIKLLMSFLYIPKRNLEDLNAELNEILEMGCGDTDEWVRILSEILKHYPESKTMNVDLENVSSIYSEIVQDIKETMSSNKHLVNLLPLECPYLNRGALIASIGAQPAPPKHFTLRRKPKSAALKAELLQKDQSMQKKSHSSLAAVNSGLLRRSDNNEKSPLKQMSSRKPTPVASVLRGLSSASLKQQNRTAKLLDINEQPMGGSVREAKRRKKMLAEADNQEEEKKKKETAKAQVTPEYALGLTTPTPTIHPETTTTSATSSETPSYASVAGFTRFPASSPAITKPELPPMNQSLSASSANFSQELQMHIDREREILSRAVSLGTQSQMNTSFKPSISLQSNATQPQSTSNQRTTPATSASSNDTPATTAPKRDLKLSREQMMAAQEMFRGANKVTKNQKALILGFMAGARDNPFPNQGSVITIKLSEDTEIMEKTLQTQLVEMLFEMNYDTGHWRRLKRTRVLAKPDKTAS